MKMSLFVVPLLALAACGEKSETAAPAAPVAAVKPPAGTEWATTVTMTPDGGYRMGNPDAPIKLVEYGSLSCSHCAEFASKASEPLRTNYVASGKVSYEYRNYVRDGMDMTATLIARCGGPGPYFALSEQIFADQANMFKKYEAVPQAQMQALAALPPAQQFAKMATVLGLDTFARQRGVTAERLNACFADQGEVDKLTKMRDRANTEFNLQGTPTFLINGMTVPDTATWEALEPKLKAAGA